MRLALAAAAVVLLRKDARRLGRVLLAATSTDRVFDLAGASPEAVADVLEASDLTDGPRACWEAALVTPGAGPRDVVLLTHPRTARDPALHAVRRRPGDRVFALTVADDGRAELSEWGAAGPVAVRSFRVDLAAAEAARPAAEPRPALRTKARPGPAPTWVGDVEPVGFPFCPGLVAEPTAFGFDAHGEWLVVAGPQGVLHGLALDGPPEVLPRPYRNGVVLKTVDAILGLNGGVVVCGRMDWSQDTTPAVTLYPPGSPVRPAGAAVAGPDLVAAYYDRATRRVTLHRLAPAVTWPRWTAHPEQNCVVVDEPPPAKKYLPAAVDLTTGETHPRPSSVMSERIVYALVEGKARLSQPAALPVVTKYTAPKPPEPYLFLAGNTMRVAAVGLAWPSFEPQRDGKPYLGGAVIDRAQFAGEVLALAVRHGGERTLAFFHGPSGRMLGELPHTHSYAPFALSRDGSLVARVGPARGGVVVNPTGGTADTLARADPAGLHNNLTVTLGANPFRLTIRVGKFAHRFSLLEGELLHTVVTSSELPTTRDHRAAPLPPEHDPGRFPPEEVVTAGGWTAVLDRLGQVLLYAAGPGLLAAVVVRRELAAAWAPGDTYWGSTALIGGPQTPDAAQILGGLLAAPDGG